MRPTPARRPPPARTAPVALLALVGLAITSGCGAGSPAADTNGGRPSSAPAMLIVCSSLDDPDQTRLLLGLAADARSVTRFELVTPDFIWHIPGQPETRRFATGESDTSPDLAASLHFDAVLDADGTLRLLDFAAPTAGAVQLEGLRGSLALHEGWREDRALGSLFHAATGNLTEVAPVQCRRFEQE